MPHTYPRISPGDIFYASDFAKRIMQTLGSRHQRDCTQCGTIEVLDTEGNVLCSLTVADRSRMVAAEARIYGGNPPIDERWNREIMQFAHEGTVECPPSDPLQTTVQREASVSAILGSARS